MKLGFETNYCFESLLETSSSLDFKGFLAFYFNLFTILVQLTPKLISHLVSMYGYICLIISIFTVFVYFLYRLIRLLSVIATELVNKTSQLREMERQIVIASHSQEPVINFT